MLDFVIGSANLTSGGLAHNLESLLLYENVRAQSNIARDVGSIWSIFAQPRAPLSRSFLQELTEGKAKALQRALRPRTPLEPAGSERARIRSLWRPLSRIPLPRSEQLRPRRPQAANAARDYLLTDILHETRSTQMQIPLQVVEGFFRVPRRDAKRIFVSVLTEDGPTQPILRPIVISGLRFGRLMRRLEVPQIAAMERPLAGIFLKLPGRNRFAYALLERDSREFKVADRLLERYGQQGGGIRRYVIGTRRDRLWSQVRRLLPSG